MEALAPLPSSEPSGRYSPADYLRISNTTDQLLDYWDGVITDRAGKPIRFDVCGRVLDMAGATPDHGRIGANISGELRQRLKGGPCEVLDPSVQVRARSLGRGAHPDVTVCCGELQMDPDTSMGPAILNPRLVFEVMSPSTQNYDTTRKADEYREIATLQEYALVWQDEPRVQTFFRSADGMWAIGAAVTDMAGSVRLRSVGVELPMSEVYARVVFPPPVATGA